MKLEFVDLIISLKLFFHKYLLKYIILYFYKNILHWCWLHNSFNINFTM